MVPAPQWPSIVSAVVAVCNLVGLLGLGVYTWVSNKNKANADDIKVVDNRSTRNESRIAVLESNYTHVPTQAQIGQLYGELRRSNEKIAGMNGRLGALAPTLQLISEHLMHQRKGE